VSFQIIWRLFFQDIWRIMRKTKGADWHDRRLHQALEPFGHPGSGFSEKGLKEAIDRLRPLFIDASPVENPPKIREKIHWVQPRLLCEVAYAEWTEDEQLR
jgi:bifunctional non-homologous end joining protein LigD